MQTPSNAHALISLERELRFYEATQFSKVFMVEQLGLESVSPPGPFSFQALLTSGKSWTTCWEALRQHRRLWGRVLGEDGS